MNKNKNTLNLMAIPGALSSDGPLTTVLKHGKIGSTPDQIAQAQQAMFILKIAQLLIDNGQEILSFGLKTKSDNK